MAGPLIATGAERTQLPPFGELASVPFPHVLDVVKGMRLLAQIAHR